MDKQEVLNDFLIGLRIILNNASAYSKGHPYFKKSVEVFKDKLDALTPFLSPVKINFSPESLFVDGKNMGNSMLYTDLASMFHKRKIKSIEIRQGFTTQELIEFLSSVSLPVKEILSLGGIQNILNKVKSNHIFVEELDYSGFLQDEGEESKDVWSYLFNETVRKGNQQEANELADNFGSIISKFKTKDLFEDEELRKGVHNFLDFLKDKEKNKFDNCSKELLKHILKDKNTSIGSGIDKIQGLFKDMDENSLAEALWDQISNNDAFNYSSFQLFSQLVSQDAHKQIALNLGQKIKSQESLKNNPATRKRIKELFSGTDKSSILEFYRHEVYSPFKDDIVEENLSFDRDFLPVNYFLVLLNLFSLEENKEKLGLVIKRLLSECERLICQKRLMYLKYLWEALDKKIKSGSFSLNDFVQFQKIIYGFVENEIFEENPAEGLDYFIDKLDKSALGVEFYFERIFNEEKVNPFVLSLFIRLFPQELGRFYEYLKEKHTKIEFMDKVVKSIERISSPRSLEMLKNIFFASGSVIKIEVLKAMQLLEDTDQEFLFSVLGKGDILLKKEALAILVKDAGFKKKALKKLLSIKSTFGNNNRLIIENLIVLEDKKIAGAEDYIILLSKRGFLWNRNVREKAIEVLRKWNVR